MWRFAFTTAKKGDIATNTYSVETEHFSPNLAALAVQHNHPEFNPADIVSMLAIKVGEDND